MNRSLSVLVLLAACGADDRAMPAPEAGGSNTPTPSSVAQYPGASSFCSGHLTGADAEDGTPGPHISWAAYGTSSAPDEVIAYYTRELGSPSHEIAGEPSWSLPLERPTRVVSVHAPSASGPWSGQCPVPEHAAAVFVLSTMARAD
jgi:hypothetical protein